MNYFKKLRILIGAFLLRRKLKNIKRTPIICNVDNAKSIGIVFNSSKKEDMASIKKLETMFKQKNIPFEVLGYIPSKHKPDELIGDSHHHYICLNDFNWLFQPKSELIHQFIQKDFDILIDLYQEDEFPIEYILKISQARFKVGCAHVNNELHDLMIDVEKKKDDATYLSEQILHYLSMLNN